MFDTSSPPRKNIVEVFDGHFPPQKRAVEAFDGSFPERKNTVEAFDASRPLRKKAVEPFDGSRSRRERAIEVSDASRVPRERRPPSTFARQPSPPMSHSHFLSSILRLLSLFVATPPGAAGWTSTGRPAQRAAGPTSP